MKGKLNNSNKLILREADVKDRILSGLDKISLPVIQTIGPSGKNVLMQNDSGEYVLTNDGVSIANQISVEDQIEDAVVNIVRDAARRTNSEAGDATSTTILFSRTFVKRAMELKSRGLSQRDIIKMFERVTDKIISKLDRSKKLVTTPKTLLEIANISANNDKAVAEIVADTIETAGLDGLVVLDMNNGEQTVVEKEPGFRIPSGMIYQNLYPDAARPQIKYEDIPVLMLDKKLYYQEECAHILRVAKDLGYERLMIVAEDFLGDAPNTLIANHAQGVIQLVLVKVSDKTQLEDLAVYIGGEVVSETGGRRIDSININDFTKASSVFVDPAKTLVRTTEESKTLRKKIVALKEELAKDKDNEKIKSRIASLTNGVVTIKVGGRTPTEAREKAYRFEDAIHAVRAAKKDGYLVGGGLTMYNAYDPKDYSTREERETAQAICKASVDQIAENAMIDLDYDKLTGSVGLNANTGQYENLLKSGVVEPYKATEMALKNAVSVANILTSIGTFIVQDYDRDNED